MGSKKVAAKKSAVKKSLDKKSVARKPTAAKAGATKAANRPASATGAASQTPAPVVLVPTEKGGLPASITEAVVAATVGTTLLPPPPRRHLRNMSEIRTFFRTNEVPVFFVGPTAFNLLGVDRWVRNSSFISFFDSWDGYHARVFSPTEIEHEPFTSGEDINNYLLRHPDVREHIGRQVRHEGVRPKVAMVFFNEETEHICEEEGYELILPSHALRNHLDSKLTTTRLGNEAAAPSVPNILTTVTSYTDLNKQARNAGLGRDLVLQLAYGDSGKTTFFVASREDWNKCSSDVIGEPLKVMKRINNLAAAVEAVNTRHGTVVGPFMTDLTGYKELTPYRGGWCGNDLYPEALTDEQRARAIEHVSKLGDRLRQEGYKGFFEVDVLVDLDSDEVYLGERNRRISGASSMTNVTAGAYADVPLFLFHLLEYFDVDYELDVDEINARWRELAAIDVWSQLIMKTSATEIRHIDKAPKTGIYRLNNDGTLDYQRNTLDWHYLNEPEEAFFLRVYGEGNFSFKGADLGILVTKSRMQTGNKLTERCQQFIEGINSCYEASPVETKPKPTNFLAYLK